MANPRSPELPDDWMVTLHERVSADLDGPQASELTTPSDQQVRDVHDCLLLLEQLKQANLTSGGSVSQMLTDTETNASADSAVQRVGRFEIIEELGRGGHGIVLLAYDPKLKRQVALKVPRPEVLASPQMRERFVREASAAARLTHRGIVQVHELGDAGPVTYIAAEYCPGKTLAAAIHAAGRFTDMQAVGTLMLRLAEAIEYANSNGVVHRDLKPANVLLLPVSKASTADAPIPAEVEPKITDFGLAKLLDTEAGCTRDGVVIGTPAYIPPELARGQVRDLNATVDVYGLGTILYEMLTGRAPFVGATDDDILRQVVAEEPTRLADLRPDTPRDLVAICEKCLAKSPANRYPSAAELGCDLRLFLAGDEATASREARKARARKFIAPALGILLTCGLLAAGGWMALNRVDGGGQSGAPPSSPMAVVPPPVVTKPWSIYVSAGETGKAGNVTQFTHEGTRLSTIRLHEAPSGMGASKGEFYLAIVTPFLNGGEILTVADDGTLNRPTLNRKFPAPIAMAVAPISEDIVIADNQSLEISRLPRANPGEVELLATARLTAEEKHFPGMSVAVSRDGYVVFSASDPQGVYRFKAEPGATLGAPLIPDYCAVAADPASPRWAALHQSNIRVFEGEQEQLVIPFPPGTIPDHYDLLTYTPDGTLLTVAHSGRGVEIDEVDLAKKQFKPLFTWSGQQIKCISVAPRMKWLADVGAH